MLLVLVLFGHHKLSSFSIHSVDCTAQLLFSRVAFAHLLNHAVVPANRCRLPRSHSYPSWSLLMQTDAIAAKSRRVCGVSIAQQHQDAPRKTRC